ncbi:MAG: hypothetical protein ACW98X_12105 [Promethearchaeota archaeon]|jgi:hypothetical protein
MTKKWYDVKYNSSIIISCVRLGLLSSIPFTFFNKPIQTTIIYSISHILDDCNIAIKQNYPLLKYNNTSKFGKMLNVTCNNISYIIFDFYLLQLFRLSKFIYIQSIFTTLNILDCMLSVSNLDNRYWKSRIGNANHALLQLSFNKNDQPTIYGDILCKIQWITQLYSYILCFYPKLYSSSMMKFILIVFVLSKYYIILRIQHLITQWKED